MNFKSKFETLPIPSCLYFQIIRPDGMRSSFSMASLGLIDICILIFKDQMTQHTLSNGSMRRFELGNLKIIILWDSGSKHINDLRCQAA